MAIYRNIHLSFWTDSKIDDYFTPEDKYFFLYLLTNPHTNICGCYEISIRAMSRELGYNEDAISRLLNRMEIEHDVIRYSRDTKEVLILHWSRYNWTNSPKLEKNIRECAEYIKNRSFRNYVLSQLHGDDTISVPYEYPIDTSASDTVTDTDTASDTTPVSDEEKTEVSNFDRFWAAYPKKVGKADARKVFERIRGISIETILNAIERLRKSEQWQKDNGQYIPHPATWLRRGGWDDELPLKARNIKHDIRTDSDYYDCAEGDSL